MSSCMAKRLILTGNVYLGVHADFFWHSIFAFTTLNLDFPLKFPQTETATDLCDCWNNSIDIRLKLFV